MKEQAIIFPKYLLGGCLGDVAAGRFPLLSIVSGDPLPFLPA
jgi:hypothetical protein